MLARTLMRMYNDRMKVPDNDNKQILIGPMNGVKYTHYGDARIEAFHNRFIELQTQLQPYGAFSDYDLRDMLLCKERGFKSHLGARSGEPRPL